ncbi:hypothetical protein RJ639_023860 [Escallonia herrerae]|uniref:Retrotransposon gag domain-containing protein n=1 Tax=Escallonia herrerae TaxID=1293975 RepID=A0AA88V1F4_9ASTE|nr:hypothetical protein RJ639_023860 [Escallonia herrerae]
MSTIIPKTWAAAQQFSGSFYRSPFTKPNPDFVRSLKSQFSPESKLLLVCQEGLSSWGICGSTTQPRKKALGAPISTTVARTTTVAVPVIPTVIPTTVVTAPASIAVVPPAMTFTPFANTVLRPLQTVGIPKPPTTGVTMDVTNTTPPAMDNQTDLMAVIRAMKQSIEKLQAAIENPPPQSGPHRPPGTSKTPEQTSHIRHVTQTAEESDDERQNPRSRRQENYYEAHSTRNTYANTGGNRAERYSNAPIIIGRPFTEEIDLFPTPPNFKMPPCESYDGTGDPMEHLARFTSGMNLHLVPDQIMCRAFPVTLKGAAHVWFQHLPPRSISCWAQLAESFRSNFLTSRVQRKNSSALFRIIQWPKESLKSYYARFNSEKLLIDHLDPGVTFAAMARGVRPGTPLRFSLNKRPPENMSDLLDSGKISSSRGRFNDVASRGNSFRAEEARSSRRKKLGRA